MTKLFRLAAVCVAMLCGGTASAQSYLNLCNKYERAELRVMTLAMVGWLPAASNEWRMKGWFVVPPGECGTVLDAFFQIHAALHIGVATPARDGVPSDYEMQTPPEIHELPDRFTSNGAYGVERFFCLPSDGSAVNDTRSTVASFETCRDDEQLRLFNYIVFVEGNMVYTLNINP